MPIVPKKSAPTRLKLEVVLVSGPASKPWTRMLLFQLLPAMSCTVEALTERAPGSATSASSARSKKARVCSFE